MSNAEVRIEGLDEALNDFERIIPKIEQGAIEAGARHGQQLADEVAGQVPYLTGTLANSLMVFATTSEASVGYSDAAPYAGWIEFGGSRGRAYVGEGRWLWPAAMSSEEPYKEAVERATTEVIDSYPWNQER